MSKFFFSYCLIVGYVLIIYLTNVAWVSSSIFTRELKLGFLGWDFIMVGDLHFDQRKFSLGNGGWYFD